MKEKEINKNYDTALYIRMDKEDKEKCVEMAKYYGLPNFSTFVRELIRQQIKLYEERKGK